MDWEKDTDSLFRLSTGAGQPDLLAASDVMRKRFDSVRLIASDLGMVLIEGETGTGKRLFARALHAHSPRRRGPFVAVSLKELSPTLLESELFGHTRGAFTGAIAEKVGLVEAAHQGTLFLDEIPKAAPATQAKILRLVEEREVRRVGDPESRKVDVAVVAASNTNLWSEVIAGRFLHDLYFRLKGDLIRIPPLRERPEDIHPLLTRYVREHARRTGRAVPLMDALVWKLLLGHRWPGNVRELENSVRGIFSSVRGDTVDRGALEEYLGPGTSGGDRESEQGSNDLRKAELLEALRRSGWKKAPAARALGISRPTLYSRMRMWGLRDLGQPGEKV